MKLYCISALLILVMFGTSASAAEVIQSVTATASSEWSASQSATNLVNNSGLRTAGSLPGNSTATTYDITGVHTYDQSAVNQWHNTGPADPNSVITFNLGGSFTMDAIHIWNGNQWGTALDLTSRGVQQFDILTSSDGVNFTEVLSNQTLQQSAAGTFISAQSFSLVGNNGVTHVQLRIDSNYGDAYTGLSEVMFTRVVDPGLSAPATRDLGAIGMLQTKSESISISNSGTSQVLNIASVTITGQDAAYFTLTSAPTSLAPGASGNLNVTFNPTGIVGDFIAKIEIESDKGGVAGTITEINLVAESLPDPYLGNSATASFGRIQPLSTKQLSIPLTNLGITENLLISSVTLTGTDAARFTVDSFPSSIAPGANAALNITFEAEEEIGDFVATAEIYCNNQGIPESLVSITLNANVDLLAKLSSPTITAASPGFNASYVAGNLFDSTTNDFASQSAGAGTPLSQANGTWVELDFGSAVTMDRMILVTRVSTVDIIGVSRLILSNDSTFEETDTIHVFSNTGSNGQGLIHSFPETTARYARWEVTTSLGSFQNLGGMELRFLNTPENWQPALPTVIGGATPFNGDYALDNAVDGDAGRATGIEYASQSLGADMFVDFDFGSATSIVGFDFFDRIPTVDRTTSFNLLFSNDPTFTTGVTTMSFSPGSKYWGYRRDFAAVTARYVRFEATATVGPSNNSGMQEILFYQEPPAQTPYESYISTTWNLNGPDAAADVDFDHDGLPNGIEFVLGSDPSQASNGEAPTWLVDATHLRFTHRLSENAISDNPVVQYSTDLITWTTALNGVNGVSITTQLDQFGSGVSGVTVAIPRSLAVGGKLFTRLSVNVATTP